MTANARGWGWVNEKIDYLFFALTLPCSPRSRARRIFGEKKKNVCGQTNLTSMVLIRLQGLNLNYSSTHVQSWNGSVGTVDWNPRKSSKRFRIFAKPSVILVKLFVVGIMEHTGD